MKKLFTVLIVAMSMLVLPAHAQTAAPVDPAASAAVRKMLTAMDYQRVMRESMKQMIKTMPSIMESGAKAAIANDARLNDAQRKQALTELETTLPAAFAKLDTMFADPTLVDEMIDAMVPLYARIFTVKEIEQMADFHSSPVGKKALAAMPQLMAEGMKIGERVMIPRINAVMSEVVKPVKK